MENEKDINKENDIVSDNSVEIDKIIEFYKDIEQDTRDEEIKTEDEIQKSSKLIEFLNKYRKKDNGDIKTEVYGLTEKGRMILYRIISAVVCVLIILGAFALAYFLPGNDKILSEQQNALREEKDYKSLKSRYDTLKTEVENLKTSNAEKKEQIDKVTDFDNSKAELRTQITAKTYELNELNAQIEAKRTQIAELDKSISEKATPQTILPPGKYVVGKNIAAGKYIVTGTGKFMIANAAGKSKLNTTLSSTPIEIQLEANDVIKFDSKVKFTSNN